MPEDSEKKLLEAARYRSLGGVRFFLKRGVPVSCRDEDGMTPLHWASQKGGADVVDLLIGEGADVNAQDAAGNTPLHYAATNGEIGITRILIKAGADITMKNSEGKSPVDLAKDFREAHPQ